VSSRIPAARRVAGERGKKGGEKEGHPRGAGVWEPPEEKGKEKAHGGQRARPVSCACRAKNWKRRGKREGGGRRQAIMVPNGRLLTVAEYSMAFRGISSGAAGTAETKKKGKRGGKGKGSRHLGTELRRRRCESNERGRKGKKREKGREGKELAAASS